jgi:hypothetical membrane protein
MDFFEKRARERLGAWLWIGCLQFFVAEQIARLGWRGRYLMSWNYISDLGTVGCGVACSRLHAVMNASFFLQGVLIAGGAMLLPRSSFPVFPRVFLLLSALGVMLVAMMPSDVNMNLHVQGANFHFGFGSLAMLFSGVLLLRQWRGATSKADRIVLAREAKAAFLAAGAAILGDLLIVYGSGPVDDMFGRGTVERLAAYPLPLWLAWTGWMLLRERSGRSSFKRSGSSHL